MNLDQLNNESRLLLEVDLKPVQGSRFQPTGFPDLGAADYQTADGTRMLLVESAQSMANRLEAVCWDEAAGDWVEQLRGLPYIRATLPDGTTTTSLVEAHRLNSPYIVNSQEFKKIQEMIGFVAEKPFDRRSLAKALFHYDVNSLVHGIFLEKVGGVVRLPRALSGFIEAKKVVIAPSGGVKIDRVQPGTTGENTTYGKANEGYGNVPFHRDEYSAESIKAYFNLDIALWRGLGFEGPSLKLLIGLALLKIRLFLHEGLRLRTACDLDVVQILCTRPQQFALPELSELKSHLPGLITEASKSFADPSITEVVYVKGAAKKKST